MINKIINKIINLFKKRRLSKIHNDFYPNTMCHRCFCPDVLYICDEELCDSCEDCHHTTDIRHAKNFKRVEVKGKVWYEEVE